MPQAAAQSAELERAPDQIEATLNYIVDDGSKVFTIVAGPGGTDTRSGGTPDPRRVTIHNGRLQTNEFMLERHGFRFVRHDTKVKEYYDEAEIRRVYYSEMEALIKAESGAKRVVVFDHTLRTADDELRESKQIREVVRRVHNDYTEWSAPQRVRDILAAGYGRVRAPGARAHRPDLCDQIQSGPQMVLVPAHAPRRGLRI